MLLFTTSYPADVLDSYSSYRSQIKRNLSIADADTLFMSDSSMNEMIRLGVISVLNDMKGVKEEFSFLTSYKQGTYSLDSLAMGVVDVRWSKNDSVKTFLYVPKEKWYQMEFKHVGEAKYEKRSSYYDFNDDNLFIYPTPVKTGDTIKYQAWRKIPSISAVDSLSIVPQKVRPMVADFITSRVAKAEGHPLASFYMGEYMRVKGTPVEVTQ